MPFNMRMQRDNWRGIGILNDSYNANPGSMKAALETLALIGGRGKKIAVLGDMFELGKHSGKEHRELGRWRQPRLPSFTCSVTKRARFAAGRYVPA